MKNNPTILGIVASVLLLVGQTVEIIWTEIVLIFSFSWTSIICYIVDYLCWIGLLVFFIVTYKKNFFCLK